MTTTVKRTNAMRQAPLIIAFEVKPGQRTVMKYPLQLVLVPPARNSPVPPAPKPGVYETAPFSCIVLVPGPHPDDRAIIGSDRGNNYSAMPIVRPDLRFIPRSPGR